LPKCDTSARRASASHRPGPQIVEESATARMIIGLQPTILMLAVCIAAEATVRCGHPFRSLGMTEDASLKAELAGRFHHARALRAHVAANRLRRKVTSITTAKSAINMMIIIMIVRVLISGGSSTGGGLVRCCGSSCSGQRSKIVRIGCADIAARLFAHARKSFAVRFPFGGSTGLASTISAGFDLASGSSEIDALASSRLWRFAERTPDSRRRLACAVPDVAQCNNDFESIGLPSYQHFRPSIRR
jgi:hypothetical protein